MTFSSWIERTGPKIVARKLRVDTSTVSLWKCGKSFPRPKKLIAINKLSKGRVTFEGMVHHFAESTKRRNR